MGDFLEYSDLVQEIRGALNPGRLKLQSNLVIFKNIKTGKVDQYNPNDIESVTWMKRARGYCLKVMLENGTIHRYDGLKEGEYEKLSQFVSKYYNTTLEKKDLSVKGWNWGVADFKGNSLSFNVDKKTAFEVPLGNVSHSTTAKNEVTLEFHQNDDAAVSLMEMRFFIPTDSTQPDKDTVQEFYNNVIAKADIIQATGESIAAFSEVQCLTPRGRYDIKIYPTFLQLHGKTFDYKIPYTTVLRLFLLPHKDGRQMFFVMSLDPPIKQGQTRYHFLISLFNKEDEMTIELGLSEEELKEKYDGKLTQEMSGLEYEVISRVFKAVVNRKITVPGGFTSHQGHQCINCSYKAATGLLYPLERGFIFVHKPPMHIRFDEIAAVNFARSAGSTRSFDFDVETKSGTVYTFVGIEKDEYGKLYDFVSQKKLRVKNIGGMSSKKQVDDDDMQGSDVEDEHDAYLERMKREGREREDDGGDDDEDSDSSDESFNPGESGSEVPEEYDSNPSTTSESDDESDEGSEEGEKKKEKKEKKEKKKSRSAKTVPEGRKKRAKKNKGDKDPNRPKRPQSAYFLWLNENREKIKKENPGITITEISKKAGEMWKEITDKTKWEKLAEVAKEEYKVAMEEYNQRKAEEGSDAEEASGKKSPKKKAGSPKKESKAGSGQDYKSKEFISSDSSSSEDKPLKKKTKKDEKSEKKSAKKEEESGEESEVGELPDEEEILSSPPASSESGSDE
ncbi:FACT complex subunit SSRP1-like isoform X2 [Liolophura sinensis]|uniref:FACT complex subunit SSRP1-like isoform X2 n=1 Tax=Liolophura sinensis TaxID=3198878 RepID=UPI0031586C5C